MPIKTKKNLFFRKQQREKLKIFNLEKLFDQHKDNHAKLKQTPPPTTTSTTTQSTVPQPQVARTKPVINPKRNRPVNSEDEDDKKGVAFASITIEEVGNSPRDYEVEGNIIRLKQNKAS